MRIDCWNYKSQKHIPEEHKNHTMQLVADVSGGCKVSCGYCDKIFKLTDDLENCPYCNKDLIYGRYDW